MAIGMLYCINISKESVCNGSSDSSCSNQQQKNLNAPMTYKHDTYYNQLGENEEFIPEYFR